MPWSTKNKNQLPVQPGTRFDDHALGAADAVRHGTPTPRSLRQRLLVEDSELTRYCAAIVDEHARRYGWSVRQRNDVIRSLRLLQTPATDPTAKIRASDVVALRRYDGNITSTIDVLAEAGLLIEDVPTRVETLLRRQVHRRPEPSRTLMREHLELWLQVMLGGSRQAPRQLPARTETVRDPHPWASRPSSRPGPKPGASRSPRSPHDDIAGCTRGPATAQPTATSPRSA